MQNPVQLLHYSTRRGFLKGAAATVGFSHWTFRETGETKPSRTIAQPARWKPHEVAKIPHGYQVAVADVNGDSKPDIMALSSEEPIVEWYENPHWKARPITTKTAHNISLAPLFHTGWPARGVALAADFSFENSSIGGSLWWAEPLENPDDDWHLRWIGQIPTSHRLRWGDIDGDGRLELVDAPIFGAGAHAPDFAVGAALSWFAVPEPLMRGHASAGDAVGGWDQHLIDNTLPVIHGLRLLDWDGDGRDEILTASFDGVHLFHSTGQGATVRWTKTRLAPGEQPGQVIPGEGASKELHRGASEIGVGRLGGKRFLATIEPWHGHQVAVYLQNAAAHGSGSWERHVIDSSFRDGHALMCADFNGDGNDEIVAGFRGPGTSLFVFTASDLSGREWKRETLDTGMATSGLAIEDINGDGRPDIVAVGASTGNVKWYENLG